MPWLSILWNFVKALFGVATKPDPVADARKETTARVRAEDRNTQLEAALRGQEAARGQERKAAEATLAYKEAATPPPLPRPQTPEEWQKDLDAINQRHKDRVIP